MLDGSIECERGAVAWSGTRSRADEAERWRVVHAELTSIAQQRAALDAKEARWLREAEQIRIWDAFGMVSMLDYLEREVGYAPRTGHDRLRVARALGDLPALTEALANGDLFHSAIRELVRVATPRTEVAWRDAALGRNLREVERLVAGHRPGDLPDDPPDEQARLHRVTFEDVDAAAFAMLRQARQILDDEHGTRLSDTQVVAALASAIVDGTVTGEHAGRARHQICYTVCPRCDRATQEGSGVSVPVDAAALAQARCDAQHVGSTHVGTPDRATQDIPPATARLVWRRDGGVCQTPGCRSARGLEIHHVIARAHGGTHDPSNLTLRCGACHRAHHAGAITIRGVAPDALQTIRNAVVAPRPVAPLEASSEGALSKGASSGDGVSASIAGATTVSATIDRANRPVSLPPRSISPRYAAAVRRTELILALTTSGWPAAVARRAVDAACAHVGASATLEELLRESFRRCLER